MPSCRHQTARPQSSHRHLPGRRAAHPDRAYRPQTAHQWNNASFNFAQSAKGDVTVLVGPGGIKPDRTFAQIELPALLKNKDVTSITYVNIEL